MSSDLLAAFGDSSDQPDQPPKPPSHYTAQPSSQDQSSLFDSFQSSSAPHDFSNAPINPSSGLDAADDDDFGDFEDAPSSTRALDPAVKNTSAYTKHSSGGILLDFHSGPTLAATARPQITDQGNSSTLWDDTRYPTSLSSTSQWQDHSSAPRRHPPIANPLVRLDKIAPDPDVLFDASQLSENDDDDDDFGDFEGDTVSSQKPPMTADAAATAPVAAVNDLLGLDEDFSHLNTASENQSGSPSKPSQDIAKSPAVKNKAASFARPTGPSTVKSSSTSSRQAAQPTKPQEKEDDWDKFADWEPSAISTSPQAPDTTPKSPVSKITSAISPPFGIEPSTNALPPTNVPPPAVILSIFPPLFADTQAKLFMPLAAQQFQIKNRILSDPKVSEFLRAYLLLATVAARIIAGRKSRWKRDSRLSQNMRIGPAATRGTSGMKLTGVDKGEVAKEDRETLDVVQAWREQLGRLRSAVAGVNSVNSSATLGNVPDLQESMLVRMAKDSEGAVTSPQPCALCGLKRNERVAKIDIDVDDSFGEWWIEQTSMHRACRNFWQQHEGALRQR